VIEESALSKADSSITLGIEDLRCAGMIRRMKKYISYPAYHATCDHAYLVIFIYNADFFVGVLGDSRDT
jgi:hypothetical protein